MKTFIQLEKVNLNFLQNIWQNVLDVIPKILLALGLILVAWIILRITLFITKRILKISKIDSLTTKLNDAKLFGKDDYTVVPSKIILKFVKYLLILIFVIIASEMLGLKMISEGIGSFIAYLPILISALLIFVIGVYLASLVKNAVISTFKSLEITGANLVSNIVFYAIVVIVTITALNQAGVDTEMITSNLTLILGSVLISFTIAFGLGSRDIVTRLLFGFYSRRNFSIGQKIKYKEVEGEIQQIDNICITVKTKDETIIIPIKDFVDSKVELL